VKNGRLKTTRGAGLVLLLVGVVFALVSCGLGVPTETELTEVEPAPGSLLGPAIVTESESSPSGSSRIRTSVSVTGIVNPDAYTCSQPGFIPFENLADGTNLSAAAIGGVQFTTIGGFTWLVGDFATGNYNGKYPNGDYTSQGTHWAWLGPNQGTGRIDFVNGPASYFSLLASVNQTPVSVDAYDSNDNLLESAGPSSINYNTGSMSELKVSRLTADIAYVIVHDTGNFFLVDSICTDAPGVTNPTNSPPMANAGSGQTVEKTSLQGASVTLDGSGSSDSDGDPITFSWSATGITFDDPTSATPTATFPPGTTEVTFTVTDDNGGTDTVIVVITVVDNTPPVLIIPADITVEEESAAGTVVPLVATATDVCDADVDITSDAPAIFPLGQTTVTFTATDDSGNNTVNTMTITVIPANNAPNADGGSDQTVEQTSLQGASVTLDGSGSSDPDGDQLTYTWREGNTIIAGPTTSSTSNVTLNLGVHTITLEVDDGNGATDSDTVVIEVEDTTAPVISLVVNPDTLWPPNHKLFEVTTVSASDVCDADPDVFISVTHNENPHNNTGDGNTEPDWEIDDDGTVRLRAERDGTGTDRIYTITVTVTDASSNSSTATAEVTVPHDQGKGKK